MQRSHTRRETPNALTGATEDPSDELQNPAALVPKCPKHPSLNTPNTLNILNPRNTKSESLKDEPEEA